MAQDDGYYYGPMVTPEANQQQQGLSEEELARKLAQERQERDELNQIAERLSDPEFSIDEIENLLELFKIVKKYAAKQAAHKESKVANPELLNQYITKLEIILTRINNIQNTLNDSEKKQTQWRYKQLRLNQLAFYELLDDAAAIIGGRFYKDGLRQKFNNWQMENTKDRIENNELSLAGKTSGSDSHKRLTERITRLKKKSGKLNARQRKLTKAQIRARYWKIYVLGSKERAYASLAAKKDYIASDNNEDSKRLERHLENAYGKHFARAESAKSICESDNKAVSDYVSMLYSYARGYIGQFLFTGIHLPEVINIKKANISIPIPEWLQKVPIGKLDWFDVRIECLMKKVGRHMGGVPIRGEDANEIMARYANIENGLSSGPRR